MPSENTALSWFRVDVDIADHPKVYELAERLQCTPAEALGLVIRLFSWTAMHYPSGDLPTRALAGMAGYVGNGRGRLATDALAEIGWLEIVGESVTVHDWWVRNGSHAKRAQYDRERRRTERENTRKLAESYGPSAGSPSDRPGVDVDVDVIQSASINASASRDVVVVSDVVLTPSPQIEKKSASGDAGNGVDREAQKLRREWAAAFAEHFWPAYPRRIDKADAAKAWEKILRSEKLVTLEAAEMLLGKILAGVAWWKRTEWDNRDANRIEYPSTWLNKRRWEVT